MNGWRSILKNNLLGSRVKDVIIHVMKLTGTCKFLFTEKKCIAFEIRTALLCKT